MPIVVPIQKGTGQAPATEESDTIVLGISNPPPHWVCEFFLNEEPPVPGGETLEIQAILNAIGRHPASGEDENINV